MLVLVALLSLGGLSVLSVRGGLASSGHTRFRMTALYGAESGAAVAMDFLRQNIDANTYWSAFVTPNNDAPLSPPGIPGNGVEPGEIGYLFGDDARSWYEVTILNNPDDPGFAGGQDTDARLTLQVTGHGPNGTITQVEWDIRSGGVTGTARSCPVYGQRGISEDGAGRNDCLSFIDGTNVAQMKPGDN
jgi:hypothetical protein